MQPLLTAVMIALTSTPLMTLAQAGARAWRPAPRPVRSEWCQQNIRFPSETGAQPGRFELVDHVYLREPLEAVDDPEVRQIVLVAATQVGKTTLVHAITLSQGDVDRAPMMFAGPDQLYCREQRDLIYALAEASPLLRMRIPPRRFRNDRAIDLERCLIYLAWSGSTQRLSGRPCKKVLCSEVDRWRSSVNLATKRTMAFRGSSTVIFEGTPVHASPTISGLYQGSDRRTFRVPCPHCGAFQELRFFVHRNGPFAGRGGVGGLQDEKGRWRSPEEARQAAYYICERGGCRIESEEKAGMVRRGVWAPDGCEVTKAGKVTGKPENPGRRRGYRLNALYAPSISFGDAAEEYLRVRDTEDGLQSFINDWLALAYRPRGKTPRWEELGRRLAGATPLGVVPPWAYFLTAAADVQEDCVYWIVRAWGDGCTSALVDRGVLKKIEGEEGEVRGSDLAQIDAAILNRKWPVVGQNPQGFRELAVCRMGIDSGHRATEVYDYVRAHPGDRVVAVAGDPKIMPGILYRLQKLEKNARTGEPYPEGTERWGIDTNAYKSDIMGRWVADLRLAGAWWLPSDILEVGEDYLRQITNERRASEEKRGKSLSYWEIINSEIGNHYWDDEVYARCMADQVVGQEWDASQWPWIAGDGKDDRAEPGPADEVAARELPQEDFSAR